MGNPRRRQINANPHEIKQPHQFISENAPEKQLVKIQQKINKAKEIFYEWKFLHKQGGKNSRLYIEIKDLERRRDKLLAGLIKR